MNLTTVASPEKLNTEPSEPSLILPAHAPQPQTVIPKYTEPTPAHTIKPSSTLLDFRPSITTTDTAPLDLTTRPKQPVNIPLEPLTPVIYCTSPTDQRTINTFDTDNTSDKAYQHYCLDPRVFFAGAPSSYLTHPLAKTLQEKANLSRRCQKSRYQRRLTPIGVQTILKEERCYLPDGSILELRESWTASSDRSTEE